jgi:ATP-dependent Clp protease ATP-binding subunit ClpA
MATATQTVHGKELDARKRSSTACHFEEALREQIVGQEEAVQALVDLYQVFCAGLHTPGRPVGNLLFLGPTGSGKTRTVEAARRKFSPEFMNRLDKVVVFHPLQREELDEVLEIELGQVQKRVLDSTTCPFLFRITREGREFLLQEGTDQRYGARHLKRAIESNVLCPLSRLLAMGASAARRCAAH